MEFEFMFIINIWGLLNGGYCSPMCQGEYGPVCCNGYQWDETIGNCIKCNLGYTGLDCSYKCWYPHYGENCKWKCFCDISFCDIAIGCVYSTKVMSTAEVEITSGKNAQFLQNQSLLGTRYTPRKPIQGENLITRMSLPDDSIQEDDSKAKTDFFIWIVLSAILVVLVLLLAIIRRKLCTTRHYVQTTKTLDETKQKAYRGLICHDNTSDTKFSHVVNMQENKNESYNASSLYEEVDEGTYVKENTTQEDMEEDCGTSISDYLTPIQIEKASL